MSKRQNSFLNVLSQFLLPFFTVLGFLFTSFKIPQWGLIFNLIAQVFWLYSGWQAWKKANQIGIFIASVMITIIVAYGVLNYWVF